MSGDPLSTTLSALATEPLREVSDWVETYGQFREQSFDRLDDYLREVQAKPEKSSSIARKIKLAEPRTPR